MKIDITTIGGRIKALRNERKMTQEDLAELLICKPATISYYEKDKVNIPMAVVQQLSEIFETSTTYIYRRNSYKSF